jgi:tetrahydromethanopterin S-methyltransferase subunit G
MQNPEGDDSYVRRRGTTVSADLPDIHAHFPAVIAAAKRSVLFPKDELDTVFTWWGTSQHEDGLTTRLEQSLPSSLVPEAEKKELQERLEDRKNQITGIKKQIQQLAQETRPDMGKLHGLSEAVNTFNEQHANDHQWVVLCEALAQAGGNLTEERMRQRIAQHALRELFVKFDYANLRYAADIEGDETTIGATEQEKDELVHALTKPLWTATERRRYKKAVRATRGAISENYSYEIGEDLKKLLDIALGDVPKRTTAVDILELQERVLVDLSQDGAFEFEVEDPEEDEDWEEEYEEDEE